MRIKKTVTKGLMLVSDSSTSIAARREVAEDSFKMFLDKFKNQTFKDFIARHQVNYLWKNYKSPRAGLPGYLVGDFKKSTIIWSTS